MLYIGYLEHHTHLGATKMPPFDTSSSDTSTNHQYKEEGLDLHQKLTKAFGHAWEEYYKIFQKYPDPCSTESEYWYLTFKHFYGKAPMCTQCKEWDELFNPKRGGLNALRARRLWKMSQWLDF